MDMFVFIVIIVGIGSLTTVIQAAMKHENEKLKLRSQGLQGASDDQRALLADAHAEIAKLKDRVHVLERLATDGDRDLARQIESLRRESANP
jgi:glutamate mutase epsilon subunit